MALLMGHPGCAALLRQAGGTAVAVMYCIRALFPERELSELAEDYCSDAGGV